MMSENIIVLDTGIRRYDCCGGIICIDIGGRKACSDQRVDQGAKGVLIGIKC